MDAAIVGPMLVADSSRPMDWRDRHLSWLMRPRSSRFAAQGFIGAPLHDGLGVLLGRLTFALPLVLRWAASFVCCTCRCGAWRLALLVIGVLAAEHLLSAGDAAWRGRWLATLLRDAIGEVGGLLVLSTFGAVLTFGAAWLAIGLRHAWRSCAWRRHAGRWRCGPHWFCWQSTSPYVQLPPNWPRSV
jgi:hypothetical protein